MVTVNTDLEAGRDYDDLAEAIAGEASSTGAVLIQCSGVADDTSMINLGGMAFTTLIVEGDPGHPAGRYNGTDFQSANHYLLNPVGRALRVTDSDVTFRGFQIRCPQECIWLNGVTGCTIKDMRCDETADDDALEDTGSSNIYENLIVRSASTGKSSIRLGSGATRIVNVVLDGGGYGIRMNGTVGVFTNNFFNGLALTDIIGSGSSTVTASNATSKSASTSHFSIFDVATPADYVSADDFRSVSGGLLADPAGDAANLPANDITGVAFVNANVSPFNEIFGAGPAPAGFSFGYFVG